MNRRDFIRGTIATILAFCARKMPGMATKAQQDATPQALGSPWVFDGVNGLAFPAYFGECHQVFLSLVRNG